VIVGAQYLGQAAPNLQDFTIARVSAKVLYDIIDRVRICGLLLDLTNVVS